MKLPILAVAGAILLPAAGCQSRRAEPDPVSCAPTAENPEAALSAEQLAGKYRLTLVATAGSKAGQSAEGNLWLRPHESAMQAVSVGGIRDTAASYVLYGSTDVDLDAVDAVRPGELDSDDPLQPGVLVIERRGTVTLRLGSEANRRDVARFDGGYMALRVAEVGAERFAGSWISGVKMQRSAGYFCATRASAR